MGYKLKRAQKTKPLKKIPEIDVILANLENGHEEIEEDDTVIHLSIDSEDRVKIGTFQEAGKIE